MDILNRVIFPLLHRGQQVVVPLFLVDTRWKSFKSIVIVQWSQREFKVGGRNAEGGGVWEGVFPPRAVCYRPSLLLSVKRVDQ